MSGIEETIVKQLEVVSGIFNRAVTVSVLDEVPPEILPGYINLFGAPRLFTSHSAYKFAPPHLKDAANWLAAKIYSEYYNKNFSGSALCEMNRKFLSAAGEPAFGREIAERIEHIVNQSKKHTKTSSLIFSRRVGEIVIDFLKDAETLPPPKTPKTEKSDSDSSDSNPPEKDVGTKEKKQTNPRKGEEEKTSKFSVKNVLKEVRHVVEDKEGRVRNEKPKYSKGNLTAAFARKIVEEKVVIPSSTRDYVKRRVKEVVLDGGRKNSPAHRLYRAKENLADIYAKTGPKISATFESEEDVKKVHGLDSGRLSSRHLVGALSLDPNIYYDMKEDVGEDTAISVIMDSSGSMRTGKLDSAGVGASVVIKAAWSKASTRLCLTSSSGSSKSLLTSIFVLKDYDQPGERDSLIEDCLTSCVFVEDIKTGGKTYDYIPSGHDPHLHAIIHEVVGLAKRPEKRKILLFFSDFHITKFPTVEFIEGELRGLDPSINASIDKAKSSSMSGRRVCNVIKDVSDKYGVQIGFVSINRSESVITRDMLSLYRDIGKIRKVKNADDLMDAIPSLCNELLKEWKTKNASKRL